MRFPCARWTLRPLDANRTALVLVFENGRTGGTAPLGMSPDEALAHLAAAGHVAGDLVRDAAGASWFLMASARA